ncbi:uncharacterized protein LOC107273446 [Cephus cinctus]|uniref:Uncharacterized protein LOC107273446 n=1 Tax=Cephus cinctus TaxID=211228 RepID=A0AAJ7CCH1_CEPCN|nr:uncharacterized protein LOC107273446 [Cephus cinctus]
MSVRSDFCRFPIWICVIGLAAANVNDNGGSKVRCSESTMEVEIARSSPEARIYLQQLKDYPDEACKPRLSDTVATFALSLLEQDMPRCGITRVLNKVTGQKVFYHRVVMEEPADSSKHTFTVTCVITEVLVQPGISRTTNHTAVRRSVLPAEFQEPDVIEILDECQGNAPVPTLGVGVRQGGTLVTGELNVSPGTPLQMEIFLDRVSAPIYGLLVTYMQVTDTKTQEETIIFNGCSVDPYLFENFNTVDGDFLTAKFRAFKFPESTYVQFRGIVNVCLDKCQGIECSNGQVGYGRKRRAVPFAANEKNKVFEVTMSTFIKMDFTDDVKMDRSLSEFIRKAENATRERPVMAEQIKEHFEYKVVETDRNATSGTTFAAPLSVILFLVLHVHL